MEAQGANELQMLSLTTCGALGERRKGRKLKLTADLGDSRIVGYE
jgi:hypothetical protein